MAEFLTTVLLGALYCVGLALFAAFAPVLVLGQALVLVAVLMNNHRQVVHGVIRLRTPKFETIAPYLPATEAEPAFRQYFFGPATRDLHQIATLTRIRYGREVDDQFRKTYARYVLDDDLSPLWGVPVWTAMVLGLLLGALVGAVLTALLVLAQLLLVLLLQGAARTAAGSLRSLDRALLKARRLHEGLLCPHCYERVLLPVYLCSSCPNRHADLRPGRYGIVRRRCGCRVLLPTTTAGGRHRLQGYCTWCDEPMSAEAGGVVESVLPLVGGRAAGKTRLMAAMLTSLHDTAAAGGRAVVPADRETLEHYTVLREVLAINGHTMGTQRTLPSAHSVLLGQRSSKRLVHIFDAAGELLTTREDSDALRYCRHARIFLFVLDPLAVEAFWNGLSPVERSRVDPTLASDVRPTLIFEQTVKAVLSMGTDLRRCRLAVAVSKRDLLVGSVPEGGLDTDGAVADWLDHRLGLGPLIRSMRQEFGEVRFFLTAAVVDQQGLTDFSINALAAWCLDGRPPTAHR
ncbi:hypothetical protein [Streptomyces sp. RKAG293]|uniref:TRAFAC clade GTPase domain-containing protein n=1 Tax=Streptomyces sp. RKAG293 TaxID=2893403 RepID=UPI0020335977|nr:hypothetical protein [Streptomyces sp. RKAG293]MCM2422612.1 hypothetical protein [Streptomyces sp. RKAG293]